VPLEELFRDPRQFQPWEPAIVLRKLASRGEIEAILQLGTLLTEKNFDSFFQLVARFHFDRQLTTEAVYDLLIEMACRSGNDALISKAVQVKRYYVGGPLDVGTVIVQAESGEPKLALVA
jgi:hypothetical protein